MYHRAATVLARGRSGTSKNHRNVSVVFAFIKKRSNRGWSASDANGTELVSRHGFFSGTTVTGMSRRGGRRATGMGSTRTMRGRGSRARGSGLGRLRSRSASTFFSCRYIPYATIVAPAKKIAATIATILIAPWTQDPCGTMTIGRGLGGGGGGGDGVCVAVGALISGSLHEDDPLSPSGRIAIGKSE